MTEPEKRYIITESILKEFEKGAPPRVRAAIFLIRHNNQYVDELEELERYLTAVHEKASPNISYIEGYMEAFDDVLSKLQEIKQRRKQ